MLSGFLSSAKCVFFEQKGLLVYCLIVFISLATVFENRSHLFTRLNPAEFEQKYSQSQYVLGEEAVEKISDSELYVYAGYAYWRGEVPTTINFEHPPLAKYYYGFFMVLLGNAYWGSIILFVLAMILIDKLSNISGLSTISRILVLVGVGSLSLVRVHTRYALLELPLLVGVLLFFYSFLSIFYIDNKQLLVLHEGHAEKNLIWSLINGLSLGIVAGSKYWFPLIIVLVNLLVVTFFFTKKIRPVLTPLVVGLLIYFLSYSLYFLTGNTLLDFLRFEWYRFNWFFGKTDSPMFLILQTLFRGRFEAYWEPGTYEIARHWTLLWPISFLFSIISAFIAILKKNWELLGILTYSFILLMIFSVGAAASDRFFIQLLPFWVMGSVYVVETVLKKIVVIMNRNEIL